MGHPVLAFRIAHGTTLGRDIGCFFFYLDVVLSSSALPILSYNVAADESKRRILEEEIRQGASIQATRGGEVQKRGKLIQSHSDS